jgi:hypothetical protein
MSKILASHMLQGNFATKKVTSLELKANSVEPSAFLPQRNKVFVKQELSSEVKATSENAMDFANLLKTKGKTAIACIGTMQSMVDFSSICINLHQHGYNHHRHLFQQRASADLPSNSSQLRCHGQQSRLGTLV